MKKQPNKGLIFSSLAFQIAIIMFWAIKLGSYLDKIFNLSNKAATLAVSAFGLIAVVWLVYQQSKKFWDS
jgi:hypothetical protein